MVESTRTVVFMPDGQMVEMVKTNGMWAPYVEGMAIPASNAIPTITSGIPIPPTVTEIPI